MPSSIAHAVAGVGVAALFAQRDEARRYWVSAALCAVVPDLDYIGAPFGNRTIALLFGGHRGFTHSIAFALLLGGIVSLVAFRGTRWDGGRLRLWAGMSLATMTHGVLDAMTTLGPAVGFLSPFSGTRYTFAWHPIHPAGGLARVLANEFVWIELPALALTATVVFLRRSATATIPIARP